MGVHNHKKVNFDFDAFRKILSEGTAPVLKSADRLEKKMTRLSSGVEGNTKTKKLGFKRKQSPEKKLTALTKRKSTITEGSVKVPGLLSYLLPKETHIAKVFDRGTRQLGGRTYHSYGLYGQEGGKKISYNLRIYENGRIVVSQRGYEKEAHGNYAQLISYLAPHAQKTRPGKTSAFTKDLLAKLNIKKTPTEPSEKSFRQFMTGLEQAFSGLDEHLGLDRALLASASALKVNPDDAFPLLRGRDTMLDSIPAPRITGLDKADMPKINIKFTERPLTLIPITAKLPDRKVAEAKPGITGIAYDHHGHLIYRTRDEVNTASHHLPEALVSLTSND